MNIKCRNCGNTIQFVVRDESIQDRFPPSWKLFGGMKFSEVEKIDRSYLEECLKDESIVGKLKEGIVKFLNN